MVVFEFHVIVYGLVEPDEPIGVLSSMNCTLCMPDPPSEFVAERVTDVPETVEPFPGVVSETAGAVVSITIFLLADRLSAGTKLVIALLSVEVAAPVADEAFNGLALSLPPTV